MLARNGIGASKRSPRACWSSGGGEPRHDETHGLATLNGGSSYGSAHGSSSSSRPLPRARSNASSNPAEFAESGREAADCLIAEDSCCALVTAFRFALPARRTTNPHKHEQQSERSECGRDHGRNGTTAGVELQEQRTIECWFPLLSVERSNRDHRRVHNDPSQNGHSGR